MYALFSVVFLLVIIGALIDIITRDDGQVRHLPKLVWILLVVLLPLVGSILWFAIGREYGAAPVDRGGFGDPRRSENLPMASPGPRSTEQELAELEKEIEFYNQQDRIRRLEAELEARRKRADPGADADRG